MKFKNYTSLTLIFVLVGCVIGNSNSGNPYKYLRTDYYKSENCTGDIYSVLYDISGKCSLGTLYNCNEYGDGFTATFFNKGCSGSNNTESFSTHTCMNGLLATCVEEMDTIPTNTMVTVTTEGECEDDPNWKNQIAALNYVNIDECLPNQGNTYISYSCNSTEPVFYIYDNENCSGGWTGYVYVDPKPCTPEYPLFTYCQ
ncbi:hypothetical protein ACTFIW_000295 [Dictyostelium discoideum]